MDETRGLGGWMRQTLKFITFKQRIPWPWRCLDTWSWLAATSLFLRLLYSFSVMIKPAYEPSGSSVRAYPGFRNMKRLGVFLHPPPLEGMLDHRKVTPSITHSYTLVERERGTVRVKCLAQGEHNKMSPARARTLTLHTAGAPEIWIDQSGFSRWEKNSLSSRQCKLTGKALKSSNFSHWRQHWIFTKGDLQFPKPFHIAKSEKYETSCVSKLLIWRQIVVRRAWPCRIIVVLIWTRCAVRRQNKPGIR